MPNASKLEPLIQKSDGAAELVRLLAQVPDVDRLGPLLDARGKARARLSSMRGAYSDVLARDASLQKRLDGIEQQLKDVNAMEAASTELEQLEADLAKTSGRSGTAVRRCVPDRTRRRRQCPWTRRRSAQSRSAAAPRPGQQQVASAKRPHLRRAERRSRRERAQQQRACPALSSGTGRRGREIATQ